MEEDDSGHAVVDDVEGVDRGSDPNRMLTPGLIGPEFEESLRLAISQYLATLPSGSLSQEVVDRATAIVSNTLADRIKNSMRWDPVSISPGYYSGEVLSKAIDGVAKEYGERIKSSMRWDPISISPGFYSGQVVAKAIDDSSGEFAESIKNSLRWERVGLSSGRYAQVALEKALEEAARELADPMKDASLKWLRQLSQLPHDPVFVGDSISWTETNEREEWPDTIPGESDSLGEVSADLEGPSSIFEKFEIDVKSLQGLLQEAHRLVARFPALDFSWRGQADAGWGILSTLYRDLRDSPEVANRVVNGVSQPFPTESDMVKLERIILDIAQAWRIGHQPAIETLSIMQHRGVKTRLLDTTRSMLLSLWFAVNDSSEDGKDARLFAIGQRQQGSGLGLRLGRIGEEGVLSARDPFWFRFDTPSERIRRAWGTGSNLRWLLPPDYDKRISAQNAGFLLDGVPNLSGELLELFQRTSRQDVTRADIAASMSVLVTPADPTDSKIDESNPLALVYSFRIPAKLKPSIRSVLDRSHGISWQTVYPDIDGIRSFLDGSPGWVGKALSGT